MQPKEAKELKLRADDDAGGLERIRRGLFSMETEHWVVKLVAQQAMVGIRGLVTGIRIGYKNPFLRVRVLLPLFFSLSLSYSSFSPGFLGSLYRMISLSNVPHFEVFFSI